MRTLLCSLALWIPAAIAAPGTWHSSGDLIERNPAAFARMDKAAIDAALARAPKLSMIDDYLRADGVAVYVHKGDLVVDGSFSNDDAIVVDGNLIVRGDYDDYKPGIGVLLVLGDMRAANVLNWGSIAVSGKLEAAGLVYAYYNDFTFEVAGPIKARALVVYDKAHGYPSVDAAVTQTDDDDNTAAALRQFVPELMVDDVLDNDYEDGTLHATAAYDVAVARVHAGLPLFRDTPGPATLRDDARRLLDPSLDDAAVAKLAASDRLLALVATMREKPSRALQQQLLDQGDPAVLERLATNPGVDKAVLAQIAQRLPQASAAVAKNPNAPATALAPMADSDDASVRIAPLEHPQAPVDRLSRLVTDRDASVRVALAQSRHVRRLPPADIAKLVRDADAAVRAELPRRDGVLGIEPLRALAGDPDPKVRLAVATALAEQALWKSVPVGDAAARNALATTLAGDADRDVRRAALPGAPAAEQERIAAAATGADAAPIAHVLAGTTRSVALMRRYADGDKELAEELAQNLALPPSVQQRLVARLQPAASRPRVSRFDLDAWNRQAGTWDAVVDELVQNANAAPAALSAVAGYCKTARGDASFCGTLLDRDDLRADVFETLAGVGDAEFREDWALTAIGSFHATRAQIQRAVPLWYDDAPELLAAFKRIDGAGDAEWFAALAASSHAQLREIAANNAATPATALVKLLGDAEADVRQPASANPSLPSAALDKAATADSWVLSNPAASDALVRRLLDRALVDDESLLADRCKALLAARALRAADG